ncbi:MAG: leucine--tRNA ligase [Candidatus Sericytochromatia bacterium]|nr:leucine--tRNA ligase [Candidatus Sericytochromatia bacterium]
MTEINTKDYNFSAIEAKWQAYWEENKTYKTDNNGSKPKYYVLDMFPYPSGNGLHVGHPKGYVGSDIIARYKRMRGFDVLHPMGWDAFGLPTERQAAKENVHPEIITKRNIDRFRNQLKKIGLSYDWDREISTTDPRYYRWTQWIFLKLYEMGLAYQAEIAVNWCPALGTVLANEEVKDGVYIETGDPVEKRLMKQWMLKITAYSDRLIADLDDLDWPESIKEMQRNWIGKSIGASVRFDIDGKDISFNVFTTRPDTLFGGTYCVLAPEHELVKAITTDEQKEKVEEYILKTSKMSERDRLIKADEKTGAFTGAYAICPVNKNKLPIWISDYVLASYGTGAVFACPAHDDRDYEFAKKFNLPIVEVISGGDLDNEAYKGDGEHINSEFLDGMGIRDATKTVIEWLEKDNSGKSEINYKLRDWLFSRQRYWGEPIPILIDPETGETSAVSEDELPILLPYLDDISPAADGQPPLAKLTEWVNVVDKKTGKKMQREVNTMPQWAGSCWYYLAFMDPYNKNMPWDKLAEKKWSPVDLYVGGTEHATLHLLYARFWHKVLYDLGQVSTIEPFQKLFNQGLVQGRSYQDDKGKYYYPEQVIEKDNKWFTKDHNLPLKSKIEKMSKSLCNVVTPDEVIDKYGADSLRLYELFMGPLEDGVIWQTENITGVKRFLERVWNLFNNESIHSEEENKPLEKMLHKTIKKVTEDIDVLQFNTAISQLMIFINDLYKQKTIAKHVFSDLVKLISPFAPHLAEELWQRLENTESVTYTEWPSFDIELTKDEKIELPVQVNGKVRCTIMIDRDATEDTVKPIAVSHEAVQKFLEDKNIVKVIYVTNKIFNMIVK